MTTEAEVGVMWVLALKTEGGHEAKNVGSFWKLERQGNCIFPTASRRTTPFDFNPRSPIPNL